MEDALSKLNQLKFDHVFCAAKKIDDYQYDGHLLNAMKVAYSFVIIFALTALYMIAQEKGGLVSLGYPPSYGYIFGGIFLAFILGIPAVMISLSKARKKRFESIHITVAKTKNPFYNPEVLENKIAVAFDDHFFNEIISAYDRKKIRKILKSQIRRNEHIRYIDVSSKNLDFIVIFKTGLKVNNGRQAITTTAYEGIQLSSILSKYKNYLSK